jgi:hypothetical protein
VEAYISAVGGTTYYRVPNYDREGGTSRISGGYTSATMPDTTASGYDFTVNPLADASLALGEPLYTDGGVLPNDALPAGSVMTSWKNRLWMAGCEDRDEVRYSKEFEEQVGVSWSDAFVVRALGDASDFTALAPVDDRLFLFKRDRIFVIAGDGPDDTGNGPYGPPEMISATVGCPWPKSVVVTDEGVYFAAATGIHLLDGAGRVTDISLPLRQMLVNRGLNTADGSRILGAARIPGTQLVAFAWDRPVYSGVAGDLNGGLYVWDQALKTWYDWSVQASAVTGGSFAAGTCAASTERLYWASSTTTAFTKLLSYDHNAANAAMRDYASMYVQSRWTTNWISIPALGDFDRIYEIHLHGQTWTATVYLSAYIHTEINGDTSTEYVGHTTPTSFAGTSAPTVVRVRPKYGKTTRVKVDLWTVDNVPVGPQFGLSAITLVVGAKGGGPRVGTTRRVQS